VDNKQDSSSQAKDDGENNLWYDISVNEGNYWSNSKRRKDYSIDGSAGSVDPFPLSSPIVPSLSTSKTLHTGIVFVFLSLIVIPLNSYFSSKRKKRYK
jgi:hypothetical protein